MKKVLIVLLSVLLLVSFVSCEKDKSEEIIKNLEDFYTVKGICESVMRTISEGSENKDSLDVKDINDYGLYYCLKALGYEDANNVKAADVRKGSTSYSSEENVIKHGYNDIEIVGKTYDTSNNPINTYTLTFNGTRTVTTIGSGDTTNFKYDFEFKVNGNDYVLSYTKDKNEKYTAASVNGNDVEVRLLNSTTSSGMGM